MHSTEPDGKINIVTSSHPPTAEAPARGVGHSGSEDHREVAFLSNFEFSNGANLTQGGMISCTEERAEGRPGRLFVG